MPYLTIEVRDLFGNKSDQVEVPDDVPINRLLVLLIERLAYPRYDATGGQLLSYKLHHLGTQKQLLDDQTLAQSGVRDGDVLRLIPEITAGGLV
ncbi:MAG: EsaB/YukD family protein [Candidatus Aminicenantales bacterium]